MPPARTGIESSLIVIKVGTSTVSTINGAPALARLGGLVEQIAQLKKEGKDVVLVSSGAVGCGKRKMGMSSLCRTPPEPGQVPPILDPIERGEKNARFLAACAAAGRRVLSRAG